jgi:hypothetical protein
MVLFLRMATNLFRTVHFNSNKKINLHFLLPILSGKARKDYLWAFGSNWADRAWMVRNVVRMRLKHERRG